MIVIPMVGRSRRFTEAGYTQPKYRLQLCGQSVFALAVGSFKTIAQKEEVLIVCLAEDGVASFAQQEMLHIGIPRFRIVELPQMTAGQADSVYQGIAAAEVPADEPLLIFNIDTFRPGFAYPAEFDVRGVDGYLECFVGSGANWSNAVPEYAGSNRVVKTSEKQQESEFCCTGLYYFSRAAGFQTAYRAELLAHGAGAGQAAELYVAPLYNHLLVAGADIRMQVCPREAVIFCGVPAEYQSLEQSGNEQLRLHVDSLIAGVAANSHTTIAAKP